MPRGGFRSGAGRPSGTGKYGTKTKTIRVPAHLADKLPQLLQSLEEFITEWEQRTQADDYDRNPRKKLARRMLEDFKVLLS